MDEKQEMTLKLILLSLVEKIPGLSLNELYGLAQDSLFFHYFDVVKACNQLQEKKLLFLSVAKDEQERDVNGKAIERVYLHENGQAVLRSLQHTIPERIQRIIQQLKSEEQAKESLHASYSPDGDGAFLCKFFAGERKRELISIHLSVADENTARQFCERWEKDASSIYQALFDLLRQ